MPVNRPGKPTELPNSLPRTSRGSFFKRLRFTRWEIEIGILRSLPLAILSIPTKKRNIQNSAGLTLRDIDERLDVARLN